MWGGGEGFIGDVCHDGSWTDVYTARYMNCYRGNMDTNFHAEQFLLSDEVLLEKMREAAGGEGGEGGEAARPEVRLTVFLTYVKDSLPNI